MGYCKKHWKRKMLAILPRHFETEIAGLLRGKQQHQVSSYRNPCILPSINV